MDEVKKTGMLEEAPGEKSSKRIMGTVAMASGIALDVFCGVMATLKSAPMPNASMTLQAGQALALVGAGLLGTTVVEKFANKGQ